MTLPFNSANRRGLRIGVLAFFAVASCHEFAVHPRGRSFSIRKISSRQTAIRNVVVLPAKVNVVRDSMKGPEGTARRNLRT